MMRGQAKVIDRDLGYKEIERQVKKLDGSSTEVGLFGSGGGPGEDLAARGAIHELGSPGARIPKRPFNRKAFDENIGDLKKVIDGLYNKVLERKIKARKLLEKTGDWFTGVVKNTVTKGGFKTLKPSTIARKKSSKALIDTAQMRNAVEHKEKMR